MYVLHRGGELLLPYFVWSSLYLIKDFVLCGNVSVRHIIYAFCAGKAVGPFYYIVVLVQLTLLTPWLVKIKKRKWMFAVTPLYLICLYIFNLYVGQMPRLYETLFPAWFLFYLMGLDCREGKLVGAITRVRNWWIVVALGVSVVEAVVLLQVGCAIGFASSQIRFGSFLYTSVIALVLMKNKEGKNTTGQIDQNDLHGVNRLLASIGDCSYGIFYAHMLVLMVAQKVVSLTWLSQIWITYFLACFVMTAIGSYLIVWGTRKVAEKLGCQSVLKVIGF